jgi:hypothetical protein
MSSVALFVTITCLYSVSSEVQRFDSPPSAVNQTLLINKEANLCGAASLRHKDLLL